MPQGQWRPIWQKAWSNKNVKSQKNKRKVKNVKSHFTHGLEPVSSTWIWMMMLVVVQVLSKKQSSPLDRHATQEGHTETPLKLSSVKYYFVLLYLIKSFGLIMKSAITLMHVHAVNYNLSIHWEIKPLCFPTNL